MIIPSVRLNRVGIDVLPVNQMIDLLRNESNNTGSQNSTSMLTDLLSNASISEEVFILFS